MPRESKTRENKEILTVCCFPNVPVPQHFMNFHLILSVIVHDGSVVGDEVTGQRS